MFTSESVISETRLPCSPAPAINALGNYDMLFFRSWNPFKIERQFKGGTSYRPDLAWIQARIDEHARTRGGP